MKIVTMTRPFKGKDGFTKYVMRETPYSNPKCAIEIRMTYNYPDAYRDNAYIAYVQACYETTREDANQLFLRLRRQGFTAEIKK